MGAAPPDGEGLPAWTADLLETLARPDTVAFFHCRERGSPAKIKVCVVARPWAVEQVPETGGTYALSLFDAADVTTRMIAFTRLSDRGEIPDRRLEISGTTFLRAMERAPSDLAGTCGLLRADGLTAGDAGLLAAAFAGCQRLAQVTVLNRPTATLLEGVSVGWFDAGTGALWQVIAPKLAIAGDYGDVGEGLLDQTLVVVRPTTNKALLEEIERGFEVSEAE
jgi:hypothetical protein